MDYYLNSQGLASPCVKEYEVSTSTDLKRGTVMTLSDGKAKKASDSDKILGVLCEDYKVNKEELNPRSGSGRVRVNVSSGAVFRQPNLKTTLAAAGTATKITLAGFTAPTTANSLKGAYLRLVSKAKDSTNTDTVGTLRAVSASAGSELTVSTGGAAAIGDVYELLLPAGFTYLALNSDATGYTLAASASSKVRVAASNPDYDFCEIVFCDHYFG